MEEKRVLVCSAWPYASGIPHLGNLVSSLLSGDVFTRYYRMRGCDVLYVSGTDAHGTRIEFEADQLGIRPAELAHRTHGQILKILDGFGIEFDCYTTTESPVHYEFVRDIYRKMDAQGYIVVKEEARAFCRQCQKFLADRFIQGTCPRCGAEGALGNQCDACGSILEPEELIEPQCAICGRREVEFRETKHWYLDLHSLAPALHDYVSKQGFQGNVAAFTQQMIRDGLRPRAMTRDIKWGIPAPFEGAEDKVIYVWGEAALGYVSATIEYFRGEDTWRRYWFGDDVRQIYTIGKDNIPFHTLIFPGQLLASGEGYHLPDQIAATEYLNWIGGKAFSKSRGVGLYCDSALQLLDGDLWRFYLLYNRPEGRDVNFSWDELQKAINGVFISNVSNLINRVVSFVQTQYQAVPPVADVPDEIRNEIANVTKQYAAAMDQGLLSRALQAACSLAVFGNEYFQRAAPWAAQNDEGVRGALHIVKALAHLLYPFVPGFSKSVLAVLGMDKADWDEMVNEAAPAKLTGDRVLIEPIDVETLRATAQAPAGGPQITMEDLSRVQLRTATILAAKPVAGADRLLQLTVDVGDELRTCVAGVREHYSSEEIVGKQITVVVNLKPTKIRGIRSQCMLLAAKDGDGLSLIVPDREVAPGTPIG